MLCAILILAAAGLLLGLLAGGGFSTPRERAIGAHFAVVYIAVVGGIVLAGVLVVWWFFESYPCCEWGLP